MSVCNEDILKHIKMLKESKGNIYNVLKGRVLCMGPAYLNIS